MAVIALGPVVHRAMESAGEFPGKVGVFNFRYLKPFDTEALARIARTYKFIVTAEDGCLKGGLYSEVCEQLAVMGLELPVSGTGIADEFAAHASQSEQRRHYGLDKDSISKKIQNLLENQK